jgi:hypothetical protein
LLLLRTCQRVLITLSSERCCFGDPHRRAYQLLLQSLSSISTAIAITVERGQIIRTTARSAIPINPIRCWQRELLQNPNWRPDECAHLPEGGALSAQQELDLAERLPAGHVSATVNYLALARNAESRASKCDAAPERPARRFGVLNLHHCTHSPLSGESGLAVKFPQQVSSSGQSATMTASQ